MTRARVAARLAHVAAVLRDDGVLKAAGGVEIVQYPSPLHASHLAAPQVFEQRLAVNQPKRGLPQCRRLSAQHPVLSDLAHETGMLVFPQLPSPRIFRNAASHQVLLVVLAIQRALDPISGFAHETSVTYCTAVHR